MATILTVEDSPSTRRIIVDTLKAAGHQVIEAENGVEALDKSASAKLDLVITDINMPHMDGIELTRKLRTETSHRFVPVLMLTTETAENKRMKGKDAGATAWIVKPFDPEKLLAVVSKVIR